MRLARRALFALAVLALPWPARAQVFPDIPSGTIIGRLSPGVGQPEQIPLGIILSNTALPAGQIWIGGSSNLAVPQTPSGDWTLSIGGVATLSNTSTARADLGLGNVATQNAGTGLANSSSNLNLQPAGASTIGGVNSITSASHNWVAYIDTAGLPHQSQPAFTDISGTLGAAQCPNPGASSLGCIESYASVSHQWINAISTLGVPSSTQPAVGDISGFGTGVATALGVNVGTAGAPVINGGALGTPSSGTLTNATGLPIAGITGLGTNVGTLLAANANGTTWTCSVLSDSTGFCNAAVGQAPATATNDGAAAGKVGEYVVSGASSRSNILASATVTITIASPAVVSWTANPYFLSTATGNGCASLVVFSTSGSLPTGLTAGTLYYVTCDGSFTANAFHVSTSVANAIAGTAVNTSGTQSGTQTATNATAISSNTPVDFGGFSLTAGDWDVTGIARFSPAASTSITIIEAGTSSATGLGGSIYSILFNSTAAQVPGANASIAGESTERVSISSTTTFFCGVNAFFTVSTMTASGVCRARRMR